VECFRWEGFEVKRRVEKYIFVDGFEEKVWVECSRWRGRIELNPNR
jgi:hypothetical protein